MADTGMTVRWLNGPDVRQTWYAKCAKCGQPSREFWATADHKLWCVKCAPK